MARTIATLLLGLMVLPTLVGAAWADDVARAEVKIRDELVQATSLECEYFPLPEILEYLSDYHGIEIVLDQAELKIMKLDLGNSEVTKKTNDRLDDTLTQILAPFNLSFMIKDGKLLVTSVPKSHAWQKQYAMETEPTK